MLKMIKLRPFNGTLKNKETKNAIAIALNDNMAGVEGLIKYRIYSF